MDDMDVDTHTKDDSMAVDSQQELDRVSMTPMDSTSQHGRGVGSNEHGKDRVLDLLFQNVVFYLNPFLGPKRVSELDRTLCDHGALKTQAIEPQDDSAWKSNVNKTTHIITEDFDFVDYKHATARGIHIVTPTWVHHSVRRGTLQNPLHYSADPSMFFSGLVLTTSGLPDYDRTLVSEAVEDFGGRYSKDLTTEVTHMICIAPGGEKYERAMQHPELGIKVVLPHWFQFCCNLKRLLPETIYQFPETPFIDMSYEVPKAQLAQGAPHLFSNSSKEVLAFLSCEPESSPPQFLDRVSIFLSSDLFVKPELLEKMIAKVKEAGGTVMQETIDEYACDMVDVVICRYRSRSLYITASHDGKIVATMDWLYHVLQTRELPSPKASLLHYPIPPEPIAGMTKLVMTISNYTGAVREYLKRMIVATGASYKPTLSSKATSDPTTHIICGNSTGHKYEKGHEWNVKVVNHLWLEDCFQNWVMQSETKSRYTLYPSHNQLSLVFGAKILPETVEDWTVAFDKDEDTPMSSDTAAPVPAAVATAGTGGTGTAASSPREKIVEVKNEVRSDVSGQLAQVNLDAGASPAPRRTLIETKTKVTPRPVARAAKASAPAPQVVSTPSSPLSPSTTGTGVSSANTTRTEKETSPPAVQAAPAAQAIESMETTPAPVSRRRGAALEASKALKKIVPDMNNFQEELRDEKRASKKKKKGSAAVVTHAHDDESTDMEVDDDGADSQKVATSSLSSTKKGASPVKRKRVSIGTGRESERTPVRSDDEEAGRETGGLGTPSKKTKRLLKESKEGHAAVGGESAVVTPTAAGKDKDGKQVKFLCTGMKDLGTKQLKQLKQLGIVPAKTIEGCTHLVAKSIARTEKFLCGLTLGKEIVREEWLQACIDAEMILDENDYRIEDPEMETKFNMDLEGSMVKAKEGKVFEDCVFYISPSTLPKLVMLKVLVEASGGKTHALLNSGVGFLKDALEASKVTLSTVAAGGGSWRDRQARKRRRSRSKSVVGSTEDGSSMAAKGKGKKQQTKRDVEDKSQEEGDESENDEEEEDEILVVVSHEADADMWQPILDTGAHVYSTEVIIQGILRQTLDLGATHVLA